MISERIPTIVIANIDEYYKRGSPPAVIAEVCTPRTPRPVTAVINPPSVVIWRPPPRFITHPGPTIRRTPHPATISIRRPIGVYVNRARVRSPDPTVVRRVSPIAVRIEILGTPNVVIIVLGVVTKALSQITLAVVYPFVNCVAGCIGNKLPVSSVVTRHDKLGGSSISQRESGCIRVDSGATAVADCKTNTTIGGNINPVEACFFRRHRCTRRIDFEVFMLPIKPGESNCSCAFHYAQGNAFNA
jgi:hypothetical protein